MADFRLDWEDAEDITSANDGDISADEPVVTIGTMIPLNPSARTLSDFGGGPNLTFGRLIGANHTWANRLHEQVQSQAPYWRLYDRVLHHYLREDWPKFLSAYREIMGATEDQPSPRNTQERHIAAFLPALLLLGPIIPGTDFGILLHDFGNSIVETSDLVTQATWAIELEESGEVSRIQTELFKCLQVFVREWESWAPGLVVRATEPGQIEDLERLQLCRDDFSLLRDLYIQVYESACQALFLAAGVLNSHIRGDPDTFGAVPEQILQANARARPPNNLRDFNALPNATKLLWFVEWDTWNQRLPLLLNKTLRNSIGHADLVHDIEHGTIAGRNFSMSYPAFTAEVLDLGSILLLMLQVCKSIRLRAANKL